MWAADLVDKIDDEHLMMAFKSEGHVYNEYRESVVGHACRVAFGDKHTAKERVFHNHGPMVARMFARGTQGRADTTRSLRAESRELVKDLGPKFTTEAQMSR